MINDNMDFIDIFENKIAAYTGFKYGITTDCCTNALMISLYYLIYHKNVIPHDFENITWVIPQYTYMSIPMMLFNLTQRRSNVMFSDIKWQRFYEIKYYYKGKLYNTGVFDAAIDLDNNIADLYNETEDPFVCISFQQKKRLSLGRGGIILTNKNHSEILKRLRYDGRNTTMSDRTEISTDKNIHIINGFHCYMEPDKAAVGILKINQPNMLPEYKEHTWQEYANLLNISNLFIAK